MIQSLRWRSRSALGAAAFALVARSVLADADLLVAKRTPASLVAPGGSIFYTIAIQNRSLTSAATGVVFTDALPGGTTLLSFAPPGNDPGSPWSCSTPAVGSAGVITCTTSMLSPNFSTGAQLSLSASKTLAEGAVVTNTATLSSTSVDPDPTNNTSSASVTVHIPKADLAVTNTVVPPIVQPGGTLKYSIILLDKGPDGDAISTSNPLLISIPAGTTMESFIPGGTMLASCPSICPSLPTGTTCCTGLISPLQFLRVDITVRVGANVPFGTLLTSTASVMGNIDPDPSNNTATAVALVGGPAVPTLSPQGALALALLLALVALITLRR